MRWLDGITDSSNMNEQNLGDSERQGSLTCCNPWGHRHNLVTEQQHMYSRMIHIWYIYKPPYLHMMLVAMGKWYK